MAEDQPPGDDGGAKDGSGDQDQERDDTVDRIAQEFGHAQQGLQSISNAVRQIIYNQHGDEFQSIENEVANDVQQQSMNQNGRGASPDPRQQAGRGASIGAMMNGLWGSQQADTVREDTRSYKQFEHSTRKVGKKIEQIKQEITGTGQNEKNEQQLNKRFQELNELIDNDFQTSLQEMQDADFFTEETGQKIEEKLGSVGDNINEAVQSINQSEDLDMDAAESDALGELQEKASQMAEKVSEMVKNMVDKMTGAETGSDSSQQSTTGMSN